MSFVLLTSAVETSSIEVQGAVSRSWETAYDILVRPPDSYTQLERDRGLVRENYLSSIYGGISLTAYREIRGLQGVEVAAPVANVGYLFPYATVQVPVNDPAAPARGLYRIKEEWIAGQGTSRYAGGTQYVYVSSNPVVISRSNEPLEILPDGRRAGVCSHFNYDTERDEGNSPFDRKESVTSFLSCFSSREVHRNESESSTPQIQGLVTAQFPMLLSAVDPNEEADLVGLDDTIVDGRMLQPSDKPKVLSKSGYPLAVPVIGSSRTYIDEHVEVVVERLTIPEGVDLSEVLSSDRGPTFVSNLEGETIQETSISTDRMYAAALDQMKGEILMSTFDGYVVAASPTYSSSPDGYLSPALVRNLDRVWSGSLGGSAPPGAEDAQFRKLARHTAAHTSIAPGAVNVAALRFVGEFDPERLPGFDPLSAVPLESYYPPALDPADDHSREVLDGKSLYPTMNVGGYIAQPPLLLTTLKSLKPLVEHYGGPNPDAPISAIRVRVAGITGPDAESQERIKRVALAIRDRTGLAVDITVGSSPRPVTINLPEGDYGQPRLTMTEGWVEKGVAVKFLNAIDKKSLVLFVVVLLVSALFLVNGAVASVRSRRKEIGTLMCMGWRERDVFKALLGELGLVGLVSGVAGAVISSLIVLGFSIEIPLIRSLMVIPVSVFLALAAGFWPARKAARMVPMEAVRPAVVDKFHPHRVRHLWSMGMFNLWRIPGRTLLGASGISVSVAALTVLLALNSAFQSVLVGTLLGESISVRVRGVDFLSVGLTFFLGAVCVVDVLFLNSRDRAAEFFTLKSVGWGERHLGRLVGYEGIGTALGGSVVGGLVGILSVSVVSGIPLDIAIRSAGLAICVGLLTGLVASVGSTMLIVRKIAPDALAEE